MKTVHVTASKPYDVLIEEGLLQQCGAHIKPFLQSDKVVIVSDDRVAPLYLNTLQKTLSDNNIQYAVYIFKNGEISKNAETYMDLLNFLAQNHINRKDTLLALGGGVVGDLTGFAAATFLRGIGFIQIPTTLLAAVDSSVGGKTAIDLDAGKNLAGAFYQPALVVCDPVTLQTLDDENFKSGMAEVIKYAVLCDRKFYDNLLARTLSVSDIIQRCVEIKSAIVACDEFDCGKRQLLNLGHTLGHGIEACSQFKIMHGIAVAAGMGLIAKVAHANGLCGAETVSEIYAVLDAYALPKDTDIPISDILEKALSDKKIMASNITLVIPEKVGHCILHTIPLDTLFEFIKKGL